MRSGVRKRKDLPRGAVSGNAELKRQKPSAKSDDIVVATAARVDTLFCGAVSRIESTRSGIANENQVSGDGGVSVDYDRSYILYSAILPKRKLH